MVLSANRVFFSLMVSRQSTCTRNHCVKVTSSCPFYFSLSRVLWIGLKQPRTRATSTSRLASMRMPSSATQRPSLCAPQSRRRICRRFTRIEQQPTNSRLVKHTLNLEPRLLYSEMFFSVKPKEKKKSESVALTRTLSIVLQRLTIYNIVTIICARKVENIRYLVIVVAHDHVL